MNGKRCTISISFKKLFLMPATGSDFSAKSDETALGFALADFALLQPLIEGPSPELPPALLLVK